MTFDDLLSDVNEGPEPEPEPADDTTGLLRQFRARLLVWLESAPGVESVMLCVPTAGDPWTELEVRFAGSSLNLALTVQE